MRPAAWTQRASAGVRLHGTPPEQAVPGRRQPFPNLATTCRSRQFRPAQRGRDFSLELLSTAADLDDRALLDAVDELWRRRLLRQHSPTTYDFAHDLLRDAAYEQLGPPQRQLLHRRIADALESLHAGDPEVVAAGLAEQYEQSGQRERAIRYHAMAAESATQVFALDDAVRHHRRALELLSHLPASAARDRRELELLEAGLPRLLALPARLVGQAEDHPAQAGQICVARAGALASAGQLRGSVHWFERVEPSPSPVSRSPTGSGCFSRTVLVP